MTQLTLQQASQQVDQLLQMGAMRQAGDLLAQMQQQAPDWPVGRRQRALFGLLTGQSQAALHELSQLALQGDEEAPLWSHIALLFLGQPTVKLSAQVFFSQLTVERLRRSPYMDYPHEVHIETLTICNAKCSFCPYPQLDRLGVKMDEPLLDKILGDLEQIPRELAFGLSPFKVNDPFLDKRIFDICQQINQRLPNARLRLFSNGSPLIDALIERTAAIGQLQHLWISLNHHEADAYQRLMQLPLARTLERLDALHRAVETGFPHPVVVSRVADGSSVDQDFVQFVNQRYPRFQVSLIRQGDWSGQVAKTVDFPVPPTGCQRWFELPILSTGKVALCCMDGEGKYILGDIRQQSALEIYNQPDYRKLREFTATRLSAAFPCDRCVI